MDWRERALAAEKARDALEKRVEVLTEALDLILPLAKGYRPEGQSAQARRTCNSWIETAEAALAPQPEAPADQDGGSSQGGGSIPSSPQEANATSAFPGWRLVPVEPTDAMIDAGTKVVEDYYDDKWSITVPDEAWAAMVAAAPPPPEGSVDAGPLQRPAHLASDSEHREEPNPLTQGGGDAG